MKMRMRMRTKMKIRARMRARMRMRMIVKMSRCPGTFNGPPVHLQSRVLRVAIEVRRSPPISPLALHLL
jgi:hypothetical protein